MKLAVVVVNYRVAALTIDCLQSLEAELRGVADARVIIVDNSSGDDSVRVIQAAIASQGWEDWAELIVAESNSGFAGGNNVALRRLLDGAAVPEYVLLLNPDTLVKPGAIAALVSVLDQHPEAGIAGSRLTFPDGGEQGTPFRFQGIASEIDRGMRLGVVSRLLRNYGVCWLPKPVEKPAEVDWVAGASMLIRIEVLRQVGLLDEGYFAYFEDMDFCLHAKRGCWSVWYVPASHVVHLEGQSSGVRTGRLPEYWFAARRRYFHKNHGFLYALAVEAAFLVACAVGTVRLLMMGRRDKADTSLLVDTWRHSVFVKGFAGEKSLSKVAMQAAVWTSIGFGGAQVLRLAANLITTRLLVPEWFGLMAIGNVLSTGLILFSDLGTAVTVIRHDSEERGFLNTVWTVQVLRGVVLWLVSLLLAFPLAAFYHDDRLRWIVPALCFAPLVAGFNATTLLTMSRHLEVRRLVRMDLISQVAGIIVMVAWAVLRPSLYALVAGAVIPAAIKMVWSHTLGERNAFAWERAAISHLLTFGRWIMLSSALVFLAAEVDRLLLARMLPFSVLGVYGVAATLAEAPRSLVMAFCSAVVYPLCAKLAQLPRVDLRRAMDGNRRPLLAAMAVLLAVFAGLGDVIVGILYDRRYAEARWMLPMLALGVWPAILAYSLDPALRAIGKPAYSAYGHAAKLCFTAVAIPFGYASWGIPGAVAAVAVNDVATYAAIAYGSRREGLGGLRGDLMASVFLILALGAIGILRHLWRYAW